MKRERADALVGEMVERLVAGGEWLDLVDDVHVFGSYRRGALEPGDVDLLVRYTASREAAAYFARCLAEGRDWHLPLRRALMGGRRGMQFLFNEAPESIQQRLGAEPLLIWRRGDAPEATRARIAAIAVDAHAGRAARHSMLPAFESIDDRLPLGVRQGLVQLTNSGVLDIAQIVLEEHAVSDERTLRQLRRWKAGSPTHRAISAAIGRIGQQRHTAGDIRIPPLRHHAKPTYAVSWTLPQLNELPADLNRWPTITTWLHIARAPARGPIRALELCRLPRTGRVDLYRLTDATA